MTCTTRPGGPDEGSVTAFTLIAVLAVLAFAGLVLDGGLAVATKVQAISVAQASARAAASDLDLTALRTTGTVRLDPAQAEATARDWLHRAGMTGTVSATADSVTVTVTTRRRTQLLGLIGLDTIPVDATATATAIRS
jgi:Putative Flp pilus-assembly TadE/G-like